MNLVVVHAEVDGVPGVAVRVERGLIAEVGLHVRPRPGDEVVDAQGGAVIPGLHDHHVHLRASAAAAASVVVGPPGVTDAASMATALRRAAASTPPGGWVRAVGYHETVAGTIDRHALDRIVADRAVRVQHRTGALWVLNTAGIEAAQVAACALPGVERDEHDAPTGRLWRMDEWLRHAVPATTHDLAAVSRAAAARGVTGFTDATPGCTQGDIDAWVQAVGDNEVVQRLHLMCPPGLRPPANARVSLGPTKLFLDDEPLPDAGDIADRVAVAHAGGHAVAVHCVTLPQLVVTMEALRRAGASGGDRIEHAGVVPPAMVPALRALGVTVVTQPNFVAERGDDYIRDVEPGEQEWLYPCASLQRAGVPVAAGTDAPFGSSDPWVAIRAATDRRTLSGRVLGAGERLDGAGALRLFLGAPDAPAAARAVRPGGPGDLCVLRAPLAAVLAAPTEEAVATTLVDGVLVRPD